MNNELYQLLLSMRIGDGCFVNQRKKSNPTYHLATNSISWDYVEYKQSIFNKYGICTAPYISHSGYGSLKVQHGFRTRVEPEITLVGRMSVEEIIQDLDIFGLCLYYLDDGTLHQKKHFMQIYCNSFTDSQTILLADKIYTLFPIKRCTLRKDRKKDGREFNYLYIPKTVTAVFSDYVREFLITNNINSLLYKTISPSQTIESIE